MCDPHRGPPPQLPQEGRKDTPFTKALQSMRGVPASAESSGVALFCRPGVTLGDSVMQMGSLISAVPMGSRRGRGPGGHMHCVRLCLNVGCKAATPGGGVTLLRIIKDPCTVQIACLQCRPLIRVLQMVTKHPWSMDF